MPYSIGDKITLDASASGATGTIFEIVGGPTALPSYRIAADHGFDDETDGMLADDRQIAALLPPDPPFEVGDQVTLAERPGTVTAIDGDGNCTVEVLVELSKMRYPSRNYFGQVAYTRVHITPSWRLRLENPYYAAA